MNTKIRSRFGRWTHRSAEEAERVAVVASKTVLASVVGMMMIAAAFLWGA